MERYTCTRGALSNALRCCYNDFDASEITSLIVASVQLLEFPCCHGFKRFLLIGYVVLALGQELGHAFLFTQFAKNRPFDECRVIEAATRDKTRQ